MARPPCCRRVADGPAASMFSPVGSPARGYAVVLMTLDELEAIRLADLEGLYHEQAAAQMAVSRPTFGRIIERARGKVADALIHGKALKVEGGPVTIVSPRGYRCPACAHRWRSQPAGPGAPRCPRCRGAPRDEAPVGPAGRRAARHRPGEKRRKRSSEVESPSGHRSKACSKETAS